MRDKVDVLFVVSSRDITNQNISCEIWNFGVFETITKYQSKCEKKNCFAVIVYCNDLLWRVLFLNEIICQ